MKKTIVCHNEFEVLVGKCEKECEDCQGYFIDEGCQTCLKDANCNPYEFGYKKVEFKN